MKRLMLMLSLVGLAMAVMAVGGAPKNTWRSFSKPAVMAGARNVAERPRIAEAYGKLPLSFEANEGETDRRVKFISRGAGYTLFLTPDEAVLALSKPQQNAETPDPLRRVPQPEKPIPAVLRIKLAGGNAKARATGVEELAGKSNYFIGNDPKKWHTDVPTYGKVKFHDVYPGVDLVYYGNQRQLEHDFIVAPGADPGAISLRLDGAKKVSLDRRGDLVLKTANGEVRFQKPVVYQEVDGVRQEIAGGYKLKGKNRVGFEVATYDVTKPLVVDPTLVYSTYLGGSGSASGNDESSFGIAVDSTGSAYVTGYTISTDFPTTTGAFQTANAGGPDAFVTKLNAAGSGLVYSTYLGGSNDDFGQGIAVDSTGSAYIAGYTASTDFPTTTGAFQTANAGGPDAFVTKLNAAGSGLVYSTYLGGSRDDYGQGIAVDSTGSAYVTGFTSSGNFPTTTGAFQTANAGSPAFVTKLNAAGSGLVYSTYLGGNGGDRGFGIAVDSTGSAYVTGFTSSGNFPTTTGAYQTAYANSFVTKLNAAGSGLVYSTYLGGFALGIAVDSVGSAYVTGFTPCCLPTTTGAFQTTFGGGTYDAFVTKLNAAGSGLVYSTYLGGSGDDFSGDDFGHGIAVDSAGSAYVTGFTSSRNFPTTTGAFQTANAGNNPLNAADAFVTKLNAAGSGLVYSTYLGGYGNDGGFGIAVDSLDSAYVTGFTSSGNFPTTTGAFQTTFGGGSHDAFVTKITFTDLKAFVQQPINPDGTSVFNASRGVVLVRFTLTLNGTATCELPPATISLTRTAGGTIGPIDESVYMAAADTGSNFRISGCQYVYNLAASSLGTGTYRVDISINGSVVGSGIFGLK